MSADNHDRVVASLAFVKTLARRLASSSPALEMDDLVQDGLLGLMDAARRFDEAQGIPFEAFATSRVRGAMVDGLRRAAWPRGLRRVRRERTRLSQTLGAEPTAQALAQHLHMPVATLQRHLSRIAAIEATIWAPVRPSPSTPHMLYVEHEARAKVRRGIAGLPPRERALIARYYFHDATMTEIGAALGVTEGRVSQLHQRALGRLRGLLATLSS
jgi:RNA polymerase sigma factor for flagellar operon FliA